MGIWPDASHFKIAHLNFIWNVFCFRSYSFSSNLLLDVFVSVLLICNVAELRLVYVLLLFERNRSDELVYVFLFFEKLWVLLCHWLMLLLFFACVSWQTECMRKSSLFHRFTKWSYEHSNPLKEIITLNNGSVLFCTWFILSSVRALLCCFLNLLSTFRFLQWRTGINVLTLASK